ncbi:MAG: hypothetical protein M3410_15815 [Acidobacteriota bacterium]|nr:hypothetical protein [Acidobacteriota bacterium]
MTVAIFKNGREDEIQLFMLGFCSDNNLGTGPFPGDNTFLQVTYPALTPGASQPCALFRELVTDNNCFVSINGLTAGDCLSVPAAGGGNVCVPMDDVAGVAVNVPSADPVFTTLVGVAMDVTLCNGNGYWTRGPGNGQIDLTGPVLLYHEVVGHGLHHCRGDFNASNPELGQAIPEENALRGVLGLPQRTAHEGACKAGGGGGGGDCYVATAAYGSEIAPEIHELRLFRDLVLRSTQWGSTFFDEFYKYYYTLSPAIAERMRENAHMTQLVRAVLVHPLMIALRLFLALPADPQDADAAKEFASRANNEYAMWVRQLPLKSSAQAQESTALLNDIVKLLDLTNNAALRRAFFDNLSEAKVTPVRLSEESAADFEHKLVMRSISEDMIHRIIGRGGTSNG